MPPQSPHKTRDFTGEPILLLVIWTRMNNLEILSNTKKSSR